MNTSTLLPVLLISLTLHTRAGSPAGDRNPGTTLRYPEAALYPQGRVIDVTRPPFNAKGDGVTDDTDALVKAYDFVVDQLRTNQPTDPKNDAKNSYILYLPAGEYLVTRPVVYSEDYVWVTNPVGQRLSATVFIRWIGENRERTVIRLKDNTPRFNGRTGEPILSLERLDFNNAVAYHSIRQLTVNTGTGNPGATGIRYAGANNSGMRDVAVVSGDGRGHTGILVNVDTSMGYWQDILVDGFKQGVIVRPAHMTHISMEYVTLRNLSRAGIVVDQASTTIRKLRSEIQVPALWVNGTAGYAMMLESDLVSGSEKYPAIAHSDGVVIARDVHTDGYASAILGPGYGYRMIRDDAKVVAEGPDVDLYIGGPTFGRGGVESPSFLELPIEDTPLVPYEQDMGKWANVNDFGAVGDGDTDDTGAVQRAMDSGATTVYFPNHTYRVDGPVTIPATVHRLNFLYGKIVSHNGKQPAFRIAENADTPIVFEDLRSEAMSWLVDHAAPRTVVMRHVGVQGYLYQNSNTEPGVRAFFENVNGLGRKDTQFGAKQKVFARFINTEFKGGPNFHVTDCDMWVMGYKYEGGSQNFRVDRGGRLELLGGVANQFGSDHHPNDNAVIHIADGEASVSFITNGPSVSDQGYTYLVKDFGGGQQTILEMKDAPPRRDSDHFLPLYSTVDEPVGE